MYLVMMKPQKKKKWMFLELFLNVQNLTRFFSSLHTVCKSKKKKEDGRKKKKQPSIKKNNSHC